MSTFIHSTRLNSLYSKFTFLPDSAFARNEKQTISHEIIFISSLIHQRNKKIKIKITLGWCLFQVDRNQNVAGTGKNMFFDMQTNVIHHYLQIFGKERFLFPYVSNNGI